MPLPTLRPAKPASVATAPCVLFELDGDGRPVDRRSLERYILGLCGAQTASPSSDWVRFAQSNQLMIDSAPMCNPGTWVTGAGRWFAIEYPTQSEAHVYFGRIGGVASSFTHVDLMRESARWVSRFRRRATRVRESLYLRFIPCVGGALIGGLESGMILVGRPPFLKTFFSNETALALLAVAVPAVTEAFTTFPSPASAELLRLALLLALWMLAYSIVRHWLILPGHAWRIDELGER
jgi:hypothetical protein